MFKTAEEFIKYIEDTTSHRVYELNNFHNYMTSINNPQLKLKTIHIAGTNGKGSTTNYLRSILQESGLKVGTFTSPYLESFYDRIRINDEFIKEEDILRYGNKYYKDYIGANLSMFEIDMAISVQYFLDNNVDIVIYEVGLGGQLDATNIINPIVSLITNIGYDHLDYLGNNILDIAKAKAGIIKEGIDLITSEKNNDIISLFKDICNSKNSNVIRVDEVNDYNISNNISYIYKDLDININTLAKYQIINSSLAIETILYLNNKYNFNISNDVICRGISKAVWKGRFEVVSNSPYIVIDGAHNVEGITALIDTCKVFKDKHITIIFTALKDKNYKEMLTLLKQISDDIIVSEFDFYRAQSANKIAEGFDVRVIADYKAAINIAVNNDSVIIITGSLYFISQVREYILTNSMKGESTQRDRS